MSETLLLPGNSRSDGEIMGKMRSYGGRWDTIQFVLPSGGMAFEYGASKFEHMATEFMKAAIVAEATSTAAPKTNDQLAEQAINRAVALCNMFQRMTVQVQPQKVPPVQTGAEMPLNAN